MKKFSLIIIAIICYANCFATTVTDSLKQQQQVNIENRLAVLKDQVDSTRNDSVKALLFTEIAEQYLKYKQLNDKKIKLAYQEEVLNYTYKALHLLSRYTDTAGLRNCFDNLATVYHDQKKYSQAKWFILQSNTLSRTANDVPNIIRSLIKLAAIKMDIRDYSLAMRDLDEALKLSIAQRDPRTESTVQLNYATLYNRMNNSKKSKIAMARHNFIDDSLRKAELAMAAKAAAESASVKKKTPTQPDKKLLSPASSGKIALL